MTTEYNKFMYVPGVGAEDGEVDPTTWKNFIKTTDLPDWYTFEELREALRDINIILTVNNELKFRNKNEYLMFMLKYS